MEAFCPLPAYNLRDYGGYGAGVGQHIRRGQLFRSAELDRLPCAYHGLLGKLNIGIVLDLRSPREIPDSRPPYMDGYRGQVVRADALDDTIPHALNGLAQLQDAAQAIAKMGEVYRRLPFSARFAESMKLYLDGLLTIDGGSLIHCFAGKDRTGLAVALCQLALGVHRDDCMAEYLLTNAAGEERLRLSLEAFRKTMDRPVDDAVLREVMLVRAEYLDGALAAITAKSSLSAYLKSLGWDDVAVACLAERYLI